MDLNTYKKYIQILNEELVPAMGCTEPIAIAYAITVNKAQGLTLDKANIVPGFFAPGQLYTAITRIKNVHNISIIGELKESDLVVDSRALSLIA